MSTISTPTSDALMPDALIPDALWLNVSPALKGFDRPLLKHLSQQLQISLWEYCQTPDEPMSLDTALVLLHDYLKHHDRPIHLLGHSTSGLLALLYARRHPERVKSLTLLSVGVHPAVDWHAHYYAQAQLLPCSRSRLLTQMVRNLFGCQSKSTAQALVKVLEKDLLTSLSPHTLFRRLSIPPGGVPVPLMVCGGADDLIVDCNQFHNWQDWMKSGDYLWLCDNSEYFFHYAYPEQTGNQILNFWASLQVPSCSSAPITSPLR